MTSLNNFQTFSSQQLRSRWLAVGLFLLALSVAAGHGWLASAGCARFSDLNGTQTMTVILSGLAFTILGALIFFYRPDGSACGSALVYPAYPRFTFTSLVVWPGICRCRVWLTWSGLTTALMPF
jgi:hypothetical protein